MADGTATSTTPRSLGHRLRSARRRRFVGRVPELAAFARALAGSPGAARVLYVHGPGGVGKSALLDRMAHDADELERPVVRVDAARFARVDLVPPVDAPTTAEPSASPRALVHEARAALADPAVAGARAVLVVDALDRCHGLEDLLRHDVLPHLPEDAVTVLAGRDAPHPDWSTDPGWRELVDLLPLGPLDDTDADALLDQRRVPPSLRDPVLRFAAGNPLALSLAADGISQEDVHWQPSPEITTTLVRRILDPSWQVEHATALAVCALSRNTTVELLRSVLDPDRAAAEFTWLSAQASVTAGPTGLHLDDLTARLLDAVNRWGDPAGYERLRRTVWRHQTERVLDEEADGPDAITELLHLSRRPGDDDTGPVQAPVALEASEDRRAAVLAVVDDVLDPACRETVEYWLERRPEAFSVYVTPDSRVPVSVLCWLRLRHREEPDTDADPVVAAVWDRVEQAGGLPPGGEVAVARFVLSRGPGTVLPPTDPRLLRWHEELVRARSRLAFSVVAVPQPGAWAPCLLDLDHHPVAGPGGDASPWEDWGLFVHDWQRVPLPTYLERVLPSGGEAPDPVGAGPDEPDLDRDAFDDALRRLLREWRDDGAVAANPVTRTPLVDDDGDRVVEVREAVAESIRDMQEDPRQVKYARALATTYVQTSLTQEAAANRLGIPFGTFRRHLAKGTSLLADRLWVRLQRRRLDAGRGERGPQAV